MKNFSQFVIYVDESGDHSLDKLNPEYPIFVLAFCMFQIDHYVNQVVPQVQKLKFDFFGHDTVILHEREIRRSCGPFTMLYDRELRLRFLSSLSKIILEAEFTIFATAIKKVDLQNKRFFDSDPYSISLKLALNAIHQALSNLDEDMYVTHLIFESRGKVEDKQLRATFEKIMQEPDFQHMSHTFKVICVPKTVNSAGLQIADMVARPIGLKVLRPSQRNQAFEIIQPKIWKPGGGLSAISGLTVFP